MLKILISSCLRLELMDKALYKIGINLSDSAAENAKSQLIECVCIMFGVEKNDMAGEEIISIMLKTRLSEEQILERLVMKFGIERLGR